MQKNNKLSRGFCARSDTGNLQSRRTKKKNKKRREGGKTKWSGVEKRARKGRVDMRPPREEKS